MNNRPGPSRGRLTHANWYRLCRELLRSGSVQGCCGGPSAAAGTPFVLAVPAGVFSVGKYYFFCWEVFLWGPSAAAGTQAVPTVPAVRAAIFCLFAGVFFLQHIFLADVSSRILVSTKHTAKLMQPSWAGLALALAGMMRELHFERIVGDRIATGYHPELKREPHFDKQIVTSIALFQSWIAIVYAAISFHLERKFDYIRASLLNRCHN